MSELNPDSPIARIVARIRGAEHRSADEREDARDFVQWICRADFAERSALWSALCEVPANELQAAHQLLEGLFSAAARNRVVGDAVETPAGREQRVERLCQLYLHLGSDHPARFWLLILLAQGGTAEELQGFSEMIVTAPPTDPNQAAAAFSLLFRLPEPEPAALFPRLLDGLGERSVATPILDLANYLTRNEHLTSHPAGDRREQLAILLGGLASQLAEWESSGAESTPQSAAALEDSVALAVALCDAIGLIGDPQYRGRLQQAMELKHRRIRTEAAAALARLGDEQGARELLQMTAEPVVRLRAIAFATELGLDEQIPPPFLTPFSRAESELALWLAQPTQFGIPPTHCELVDERSLFWPGYDTPQDCFLLRFSYVFGESEYANVGIAGPTTHAFAADVQSLTADDQYALFAGWDVEHEEIYEIPADGLNDELKREAARLETRLRTSGYEGIEPVLLGYFFGQRALAVRAVKQGEPALAVVDDQEILSRSPGSGPRPLQPEDIYCLYKGRLLLRSFARDE